MTDEQYYQMRNQEGGVKVPAAESPLVRALQRGRRRLPIALVRRQEAMAVPGGKVRGRPHTSG